MKRLFTGIDIPQEIKDRLHLMQCGISGAKWDFVDNFHITLSFIGDIDEAMAGDVYGLLSTINLPSFDLTLNGIGTFDKGERLTHLWVGVEANQDLIDLKKKIDSLLKHNGIPFDNRKYTPHVSIARLKSANEEQVAKFIQEHNLFKPHSFKVGEFNLYQSFRGKNGTHYQVDSTYELL